MIDGLQWRRLPRLAGHHNAIDNVELDAKLLFERPSMGRSIASPLLRSIRLPVGRTVLLPVLLPIVVHLKIQGGKAYRADRAGNISGAPIELEAERSRLYADTTAWMILGQFAREVTAVDGNDRRRADAGVLLRIGRCRFPLLRPNPDDLGHFTHDLGPLGEVVCQKHQRALALALLTVCPLRIGSLCSLRMDRHFNWSGGAMQGDLIIEFDEGELKNDEPASFPIPREVASLIRTYWTRFRPLQDPRGSPYLFCGRDPNRPRAKSMFSTVLTRLVFDRLGLHVNPHLYRHIVHLVVLRKFPGAYAMIARVLTHRSIGTTTQNYSHHDGELTMRAYQRMVEGITTGDPCREGHNLGAIAYNLDREDRHGWR